MSSLVAQPLAPPSTRERRQSLVNSLFLLVLLCAVALTPINHLVASNDPDLWLDLRTGNWILQHGSVPTHDAFSSPMTGQPWIVYHWLFDVLAAKLFEFQ